MDASDRWAEQALKNTDASDAYAESILAPYQPAVAPTRSGDIGSLKAGFLSRLKKQAVGAEQIGSDLARMFAGEIGQPYSPYRQMIESEAAKLIEQSKDMPWLTKAGDIGMMALESMALPVGRSALGRVSANALTGGGMAALEPYATPEERGQAGLYGALFGGLVPEVVGPMARAGMAAPGYMRGIVDRPYGAAKEISRELGDRELPKDLAGLFGAPPPGGMGPMKPPFANIPGASPTAAMVYQDPVTLELEQNARLRSAPAFAARDVANKMAVIKEMESRALPYSEDAARMAALNQETGALRESALASARSADIYDLTAPVQAEIDRITTSPGTRASQAAQILAEKTAESALGKGKVYEGAPDPADLYQARKNIDDALAGLAGPNEALTHAAKSSRNTAMQLKNAIDEGLNAASAGEWSKYLDVYKTKIKPIEEGRAFRDLMEKSDLRPRIPETQYGEITPAMMRKFAQEGSYKELGTSLVDLLSPQGRAATSDAESLLNALEIAQKGARANIGSPTAGYLVGLAKSGVGMVPGGGKIASAINLMDALGRSRGASYLDEALLDPEKYASLLDLARKQQTPSGVTQMMQRTSAALPSVIKSPAEYLTGRVTRRFR